ncbi:MAG: WYL domain-containing protein [Lachnospiraceae bacterium]|nr:WYL domain-containing protein [Lachnospiraceae bacterium]
MGLKQPKKLLIVNILDILRKYSDVNHRLSQKEIADLLQSDYGVTAERKAIRRNILGLMECGYEIEYTESVRMVPNPKTGVPEESYLWSDFYLVRDFTDAELRLLIDSLLFSKHIPYSQCKELVEKLERLSSKYFRAHVRHIHTMPDTNPANQQLFYTIEVLDEAISAGKKVSFTYLDYGTDKQPYRRRRSDGSLREYVVSPYQMAAKEGKYYLICNHDRFDNASNYRVERIADIQLLDEPARPFATLEGSDGQRLDLAKYMAEHIYMYAGGNTRVKFRIVREMIGDVLDIFGPNVRFCDETDSHVCVIADVNERGMLQFAKNYGPDVLILEPKALVEAMREDAKNLLEAYQR